MRGPCRAASPQPLLQSSCAASARVETSCRCDNSAFGGALGLERGAFFQPWGAFSSPGLLVAAAGLSTALGRYAGPAIRLDLRGGALTRERGSEPLLEARLRAESPIAAASLIGVAVPRAAASAGAALLARLRLGTFTGPALRLDLAGAGGADARAARLLAAWTSAVPSAEPALLSTSGCSTLRPKN